MIILLFLGGLLFFKVIEYLVHRFVFHIVENAQWKKNLAYTMHGVHHEYPKDKMRLAMPPPLSLVIATLFLGIFYLAFGIYGFGVTAGFLIGYAAYLFVHYMVHAAKPPKNAFKTLWVHHSIHHFKNQEVAFGVTSPLWDVIFRTMPK
jgi:sterol desaturase/sphingolipid hydroxylase (fatty acid hydroxylase superfamily)